jgi:hypothetical protein
MTKTKIPMQIERGISILSLKKARTERRKYQWEIMGMSHPKYSQSIVPWLINAVGLCFNKQGEF